MTRAGAMVTTARAAEGGMLMIPWIYADLDTIIDCYSSPAEEGE